MPVVVAPYHLDEYLPSLAAAVPSAEVVLGDPPSGATPWARFGSLRELVARAVERVSGASSGASSRGGRIDVVTGDCLLAAGTVLGLQRAGVDPAVVWFDAHGDVHTVDSSTSGYAGGMALRVVAGHRPPEWDDAGGLRGVDESRVVLVGARDLDPPEVEFLAGSPIRQVSVEDLDAAALPPGPLLLHVDVDVVDAADLPGLRFPVTPGPSASDVVAAVQRVLATGRVVAFDVACAWDPEVVTDAGPHLLRTLLES
jgi:arginase